MLIKGHNLDDELIIEIGKFAVLWNLFEKEHCQYDYKLKKIEFICGHVSASQDKQAALADALNQRSSWYNQLYVDCISRDLFSDDRGPKESELKYIESFLKREDDTLCGCLLCIYRIRCNMMHGLKEVETLNSQLAIFKAANGVLEDLHYGR